MYPKPCGVCQGRVPAGEGTVQGSHASGWTVTHEACPRGSIRHGYAQAFARRVISVLRRTNAAEDEITESLWGLSALMRTGWTSRESCEKIILSANALGHWDRLAVEEVLDRYLVQEGSRC